VLRCRNVLLVVSNLENEGTAITQWSSIIWQKNGIPRFSYQNKDKESVKIVVNMGGKGGRMTVKSGWKWLRVLIVKQCARYYERVKKSDSVWNKKQLRKWGLYRYKQRGCHGRKDIWRFRGVWIILNPNMPLRNKQGERVHVFRCITQIRKNKTSDVTFKSRCRNIY
jgi:hypothetical protein